MKPNTYPDTFQITTARLHVADVVIMHPTSYEVLAVIEVKSPYDLFYSYTTGRLDSQVRSLRKSAARHRFVAVVGGRLDGVVGVVCENYFDNKRLHEKFQPNLLRLHARSIERYCTCNSVPISLRWFATKAMYFTYITGLRVD